MRSECIGNFMLAAAAKTQMLTPPDSSWNPSRWSCTDRDTRSDTDTDTGHVNAFNGSIPGIALSAI